MKVGKATSKYFRTLIFLLFFFLNEAVPNAAFAFSSLNACAKSRECLALLKESAGTAVSAPTGAGYGVTTLRTTTSSGAIKTFVNGVADFAIVVGPSAAYVGWHYWNEAHNGRAQDRAKQRYCAAYPQDEVCIPFTGGQGVCVPYIVDMTWQLKEGANTYSGGHRQILFGAIREIFVKSFPAGGALIVAKSGGTSGQQCDSSSSREVGIYQVGSPATLANPKITKVVRQEGLPDTGGNPPPLPWKDWSQQKRDTAVSLLSDADWQRLRICHEIKFTNL